MYIIMLYTSTISLCHFVVVSLMLSQANMNVLTQTLLRINVDIVLSIVLLSIAEKSMVLIFQHPANWIVLLEKTYQMSDISKRCNIRTLYNNTGKPPADLVVIVQDFFLMDDFPSRSLITSCITNQSLRGSKVSYSHWTQSPGY